MLHRKLTLAVGLGALIILTPPAVAQAATGTPASAGSMSRVRPDNYAVFTGYTYPGTSAGLASCNAEGPAQVAKYDADKWRCSLGLPDAGRYGLYVVYEFSCPPSGCPRPLQDKVSRPR